MKKHKCLFFICLLLFCLFLKVKAEEISTAGPVSYKIQKYTAFNKIVEVLTESFIKLVLKVKTRAETISVDLKIFSGWDLILKKAQSLNIYAEKLFLKDIPVESFKLVTGEPIFFRKGQVVFPLSLTIEIVVSVKRITEILNTLPKWKRVLEKIDLPMPPFGSTKIALSDLKLQIDENKVVTVKALIKSLIDPESGPINFSFKGHLIIKDKRIIIDDIKADIEDIFTEDMELSKSFSKFLEDLVNPIFDFHKYEKKGFTIDFVELNLKSDNLVLLIQGRLTPKNNDTTK